MATNRYSRNGHVGVTVSADSYTYATSNSSWNGTDITGTLERTEKRLAEIEARLGILQPNPALEEDYLVLKRLGDQYRELEQKILAQERMASILRD